MIRMPVQHGPPGVRAETAGTRGWVRLEVPELVEVTQIAEARRVSAYRCVDGLRRKKHTKFEINSESNAVM